jgi:predicted short-subunit dehydrogenase-like oxidoreductase (DUF2520 family)
MRIGFIGSGKVATAFGRYLHIKGATVSGYFDRHPEKTAHASQQTQSAAFQSSADAAARSDMIFITTRDDQIEETCRQLCRENSIASRHLVGHMSGAHSSRLLSDAQNLGATVFSLHPLQAFADEKESLEALPKTYFSLEGDMARLEPVTDLLARMGNRYFTLAPEHKSLYHLSACILSNYLVTLAASGMAALEQAGIDPQEGFQAMRPLMDGTLANIAQLGPSRALTGPIARGDAGTISQHMEALEAQGLEHIKSVYAFMGLKTLDLAGIEVTTTLDKAAAVKQLLEGN